MPLLTGQTTLTDATQVSSTTATTGITANDATDMLTSLIVTAPAAAITVGRSNIATVPGTTVASTATVNFIFGLPGVMLKEIYFKGTNSQVVNWTASTT